MSTTHDLLAAAKSAGKRPVTDLEIVPVGNIKPSDIGKAVRVKVYRKWTVVSARGARPAVLTFILLDQTGGAIQANVEPRERIRFENTFEMGRAYTITGFGLMDAKKWMQPLPNNFILMLGKLTDVHPFSGDHFPAHYFSFASYDELPLRADRNDVILTDYIGCVLHVGDLRQPGVGNQNPVIWRDIILRNLEGNTVRFTLWNEKARDFDTDLYEKEPKPTVMAVSSCWVRTYGGLQLSSTIATYYYLNPPIPETEYILSMYGELLAPPVIQNIRAQRYDDIDQEKSRNRTTIDELLREDPRNQTNVRFTVIGTVAYVVGGRAWYFRRCKDCRCKIFQDRLHGHCKQPDPGEPKDYSYCFRIAIADVTGALILTCFSNEAHSVVTDCNKVVSEEGYTDPYTLPPVLAALEGTTHLFQLHFATESTKENPVYILDTVMESGQHLLPAAENNPAIDEADIQITNEVLYLTGPEDEAEKGNGAGCSAETPLAAPSPPTIFATPNMATTQATNETLEMSQATTPPSLESVQTPPAVTIEATSQLQLPAGKPPATRTSVASTPPSLESVQTPPAVTIEATSQLQLPAGKPPATRTSVRRQLLKDEAVDQSPVTTKRTKQE